MQKDAVVTVRIPVALKRKLEAGARRAHRSLSAQVLTYLERAAEAEAPAPAEAGTKLLGLYEGAPVPTDDDFDEARRHLWSALGKRRVHRGA